MRKPALIFFLFLILCSCSEKQPKENGNQSLLDSISTKEKTLEKTNIPDTNSNESNDIYSSETKHFMMKRHFEDFAVDSVDHNITAPLDLSSHKLGQLYRTIIKGNYNEIGVNFAGHFCLASWGCGSSCYESVVVDTRTGKISDGISSAWGYDFRKESKMIIVNPPDSNGMYDESPIYGGPRVYVFDEATKTFELIQ